MQVQAMGFPSAIWRFRDKTRLNDGYLFVHADEGIIIPVILLEKGKGVGYVGFGLWFHDIGDFEIATTHVYQSDRHRWLHEYYRIEGDWMQWSNNRANISHERVRDEEVPEACQVQRRKVLRYGLRNPRPDYDPGSLENS